MADPVKRHGPAGPTDDDLAHARLAGEMAAANGRDDGSCPTWAIGEQGRPWRESWLAGYRSKAKAPPPGAVPSDSPGKKQPIRSGKRR